MTVQISVVVPTYRRPDLLRGCLEALLKQDFPPDRYEIIVADNAESQDTRSLVEALASLGGPADAAKHPPVFYLPAAQKPGPAAARNIGWRFAHADIIAFTDDDCLPQPAWLREGLRAMQAGYDGLSGRVVVPLDGTPTDYEKNTARLATAEFLTANCFIRCSVLEATGGFDERFTAAWREDSDLHLSMLERSQVIGTAPAAVVVHPVRKAGWGVSLREQRKSAFNALLFKKHPRLYRERIQKGPPWLYYGSLAALLAGLVLAAGGLWVAAGLLLGAWAVQTAVFALRRLRGTRHTPGHVAEMLLTSALVPPLSIFWRLYGALKYRVWFW